MIKKILVFLVTIFIIAFGALSIFWFIKTQTVRKYIASFQAPGFTVNASSLAVSGFPFKQTYKIQDVTIKPNSLESLHDSLNSTTAQITNNSLEIPNLQLSSSIFSNNFTATFLEDLQVNEEDQQYQVKYNKPPVIKMLIEDGLMKSYSYLDSGYKIVDVAGNVLFENGSSQVNYNSVIQGQQKISKLTLTVQNIGYLSALKKISQSLETSEETSLINNLEQNKIEVTKSEKQASETAAVKISVNPQEKIIPENLALNYQDLNVRNIKLDLEIISNNPFNSDAKLPDLAVEDLDAEDVREPETKIKSIKINNFEFSNPIYNVKINGNVSGLDQEVPTAFNLSLKIEKFETILSYLKQALDDSEKFANQKKALEIPENAVPLPDDLEQEIAADGQIADVAPAVEEKIENNSKELVEPEKPNQTFGFDVIQTIRDVAAKNLASSGQIAVFDFSKDGENLIINGMTFLEIMMRSYPNDDLNNGGLLIDPTSFGNEAPIPNLVPLEVPEETAPLEDVEVPAEEISTENTAS